MEYVGYLEGYEYWVIKSQEDLENNIDDFLGKKHLNYSEFKNDIWPKVFPICIKREVINGDYDSDWEIVSKEEAVCCLKGFMSLVLSDIKIKCVFLWNFVKFFFLRNKAREAKNV